MIPVQSFGKDQHLDQIWQISWNPQGTMLASCSADKSVRLWRVNSSKATAIGDALEDGHNRAIRSVAFSPNNTVLATASFDGTVGLWYPVSSSSNNSTDKNAFEFVTCLEGHENEVKCVDWSSDGKLLATCGRDKTVWIWECMEAEEDFQCLAVLQEHQQDVKSVKWHPNREWLISCSYDDTIKVWVEDDMDDWACVQTLTGHQSTVWSVDFDKSGDYIVSVGEDLSVRVWKRDINNNSRPQYQLCAQLDGCHKRTIYSVSWSHLNDIIATGAGDDSVKFFRFNRQTETIVAIDSLNKSNAHTTDVNCVRWSPADPSLLATCGDEDIRLWKLQINN